MKSVSPPSPKKREEILSSERLARAILDQATQAIVICDEKGQITQASEEARRLAGDRILGKSFDEAFPVHFPSKEPGKDAPFSIKGVLNGMFFRGAEVTLPLDGRNPYFLLNARPLFDKKNKILGAMAVLIRISDLERLLNEVNRSRTKLEETVKERTAELVRKNKELHQENVERRRAEWALQHTNELLEKVFSSIDILIAYMDRDFNFIRVNRAYAAAGGHDPEFYLGRNHFVLYPDAENEQIFRRVVETGEPFIAFEKRLVYPCSPERGETYWDLSLQPVKGPDGRVDGVVLSLIDVTSRIRAEAEARDERAFRNSIQECMIDGILTTAPDGEITYANPSFCKLVGFRPEELLGLRPPYPFWAEEESAAYKKAQTKLFRGKSPLPPMERRYRKRNGEVFDVTILSSPLRNSKGRQLGWVASVIDITDRKRMEKSLQESEKLLHHLSAQLLAAQENERKKVARELHDSIGACLSAIKYGVENSLHQIADGVAAGGAAVHTKSMEALIPMVQQCIEEVRRMQTDLRPSILDDLGILPTIGWFCREFEKIYATIRTEKDLDVEESEVPEDLKLVIYRLLQEGLNNVAKHSGADCVRLGLCRSQEVLEFSIWDNGRGFNPREGMFEKNSGSGIGLPSMRERTELSGGSFFVESKPGKGTLIRASWPLK